MNVHAELKQRIEKYEVLSETLLHLAVTGGYWGEARHDSVWFKCLERIGEKSERRAGYDALREFSMYPALLLFYGAGMAAMLTKPRARTASGEKPLLLVLYPWRIMDPDIQHKVLHEREYTPLSNRIYQVMRGPLRDIVPQESQYERLFDRFEYIRALVHADSTLKEGKGLFYPIGCFGWRNALSERTIMNELTSEFEQGEGSYSILKFGLFGGSPERLAEVKAAVDDDIKRRGWGW